MGKQIVRQPNGLFALWSSCVDNFTVLDATETEIVEELTAEFRRQCVATVRYAIKDIDDGIRRTQFAMNFDECVARIREVHGDDNETLKMLDNLEPPVPKS
jgi:hypothetical protein